MNIQEATKKALETNGYMKRCVMEKSRMRIKPTNSRDCCIISIKDYNHPPSRYWNPTADDLMADDWEVV